jgi:thiol-disulfide isomerase/thioredoxin
MKLLIIFIYLVTANFGYAVEKPNIKNLVLTKNSKIYEEVIFNDINQKNVDIGGYRGKLILLNFWATWCAPCREEMPSLDLLQSDDRLNNLIIFPINIGQEDLKKSINFFEELNIKNLDIYFDPTISLVKKFSLRGIPTSILINKEGEEFARIIGSIDFKDEKFISWLKNFN